MEKISGKVREFCQPGKVETMAINMVLRPMLRTFFLSL